MADWFKTRGVVGAVSAPRPGQFFPLCAALVGEAQRWQTDHRWRVWFPFLDLFEDTRVGRSEGAGGRGGGGLAYDCWCVNVFTGKLWLGCGSKGDWSFYLPQSQDRGAPVLIYSLVQCLVFYLFLTFYYDFAHLLTVCLSVVCLGQIALEPREEHDVWLWRSLSPQVNHTAPQELKQIDRAKTEMHKSLIWVSWYYLVKKPNPNTCSCRTTIQIRIRTQKTVGESTKARHLSPNLHIEASNRGNTASMHHIISNNTHNWMFSFMQVETNTQMDSEGEIGSKTAAHFFLLSRECTNGHLLQKVTKVSSWFVFFRFTHFPISAQVSTLSHR